MQTIIRLATILMFLFCFNFLFAEGNDIIGKDDAKAMFALSLEEWKQNLLMGKAGEAFDYEYQQQIRVYVNLVSSSGKGVGYSILFRK